MTNSATEDTQIAHFLRFCKGGGAKENCPKKQADFRGSKNTLAQTALSAYQYALIANIAQHFNLRQTAAPKVPAKASYAKFGKDIQIAHFLRFCRGGTKENGPKKQANFSGSKHTRRKRLYLLISMRLKCKHRTTFLNGKSWICFEVDFSQKSNIYKFFDKMYIYCNLKVLKDTALKVTIS